MTGATMKPSRFKCIVLIELLTLFTIAAFTYIRPTFHPLQSHNSSQTPVSSGNAEPPASSADKDFIKWVDFKVTSAAMNDAYQYDLKAHESDTPIDWVCLLAILGAKYGGDFKNYKSSDMKAIADKILNKESTLDELTADMKYYDYYNEAYHAVLGGFVGEYQLPGSDSNEMQYGLKAFSPIAKGFPYTDYDDFGSSRSFGYRRQHLGHDMMGQIGTAIIILTRVTLKNNTKISIIENTFFYNLPNQFVLFSVFQIFKIIQKKADLAVYIVDRLFLLFRKAGLTPAGLNICLQLTQFIVQSIDLTENMPG